MAIAILLDEDLIARAEAVAREAGQGVASFVAEAIEEKLGQPARVLEYRPPAQRAPRVKVNYLKLVSLLWLVHAPLGFIVIGFSGGHRSMIQFFSAPLGLIYTPYHRRDGELLNILFYLANSLFCAICIAGVVFAISEIRRDQQAIGEHRG